MAIRQRGCGLGLSEGRSVYLQSWNGRAIHGHRDRDEKPRIEPCPFDQDRQSNRLASLSRLLEPGDATPNPELSAEQEKQAKADAGQ